MDPKLIMAIDIVDVLRTLADPLAGAGHRNVLLHAAQHIEDLRRAAEKASAVLAEVPITRSYDPNDYKEVGE